VSLVIFYITLILSKDFRVYTTLYHCTVAVGGLGYTKKLLLVLSFHHAFVIICIK